MPVPFLLALVLALSSTPAFANPCGSRILGLFASPSPSDEEPVVFPVAGYGPGTAFRQLLVSAPVGSQLELTLLRRPTDTFGHVKRFALTGSGLRSGYQQAVALEPSRLFSGPRKYFVVRVYDPSGELACEDLPKPVLL